MSETSESYIDRLCEALADVLNRAAAGTRDRLAGYVANFDFWIQEADHCLRLVKEYEERFARFQAAQHVVTNGGAIAWDERGGWMPPPMELKRSSSWNQRKEARRKVVGALEKFLTRCAKEEFISQTTRSAMAAKFN